MEMKTKNRYLRKRLVRLLRKRLLELNDEVHGTFVTDVESNIKLVANVIERMELRLAQIDEPFIAHTMIIAGTDEPSQKIAKSIINEIIQDVRDNETVHAHKEYTIELFQIKWTSKARKRRRHRQAAIG